MDKKRVLIVQPIHESGVRVFDDRFAVRLASDPSVDTVIKEIQGVEGVIVRTAPFPRAIIEAADRLRVIARHGVGVDNIDIEAATERGILVVNTPDTTALSVAEHTIIAMGALAKRLRQLDHATRSGAWDVRDEFRTFDLDGKILGLVGLGRIGSLVARKARGAFDMQVLAYDPFVTPEAAAASGITLVAELPELFRRADVVSLHVPLTPQTRHLVGPDLLGCMKPSALLLNFARGDIVQEQALYEALASGAIGGAALDVYQQEPPAPNNPIFMLDNVLLSPHCSALTQECVIRTATGAARGVFEVLTGGTPAHVVNPAVLANAASAR